MSKAIILSLDVTLPKFLWKYLYRLLEDSKHLTNEVIATFWNEDGFSLLKKSGEASSLLKGIIQKPKNIPSRVYRNILENAGRIIRSQIERKEIFEELIKRSVEGNFSIREYVKETKKNIILVENVLKQIENLKKKGELLDTYFQLSPPEFKGTVFLTSADDSIEKGQFKKLKVTEEFIELEIKLPVAKESWKWFKVKIRTPKKIREVLEIGGKVKAPLIKRVKNKNNKDVYVLSIPFEIKVEEDLELNDRILGIDLSPSVNRLAVGVIKEEDRKSSPIYFKADKLIRKILRIRFEISRLESKIDNIRNELRRIKNIKHKEKLKKRLKHLFSEQKLRLRKVRNLRKQILELLTKWIVEIAKQSKVGLVTIEKLEFKELPEWKDKTLRWLFSSWFYSKFSERLKHKLSRWGIRLRRVNPANTTKKCHICGKKLDGKGLYLFCKECQRKWDRDYNASVNIAERGFKILLKIKEKLTEKLSQLQKEGKPVGLALKGVREITVPPDSLLQSWNRIVEVVTPHPRKLLVSSVKENGTESL